MKTFPVAKNEQIFAMLDAERTDGLIEVRGVGMSLVKEMKNEVLRDLLN